MSKGQDRQRTASRGNAARLADAYEQLETVLEAVDLGDNPEVADAVIDAIEATDEAYTRARETTLEQQSDWTPGK
jgi:hypothetical protein